MLHYTITVELTLVLIDDSHRNGHAFVLPRALLSNVNPEYCL